MKKYIPKLIGILINTVALVSPLYAGKISIGLFSKPRKGKIKPNQTTFLATSVKHTLQHEHFKIRVYEWPGTKATILLAHGWESNAFRWKDLAELLIQNNYNIIALDAPAHGNTEHKQFNAVLYAECIQLVAKTFKPNIVIGHSVGGMALAFALSKYKLNTIDKLVLLGAPNAFSTILASYEKLMGYSKRTQLGNRRYIQQKFNFTPEEFSTSRFVSTLNIKGLIVHDKKDKVIPYSDGTDIAKQFTNAKFISTKGYGHGLKSDEVHKHILNFLNA